MEKKQPKQIKSKQSNFYFETEAEAVRVLKSEGRRLKYIALKVWRKHLSNPKPKAYIRTRDSQRSIKLGKVRKVGSNEYTIELTFENDLAYHESVVGKDQPEGHAIMLLSSGWEARNLEKKIGIRERFTRYKGFNYLGEVQKAFNNGKHKGIQLQINWSGRYLK